MLRTVLTLLKAIVLLEYFDLLLAFSYFTSINIAFGSSVQV